MTGPIDVSIADPRGHRQRRRQCLALSLALLVAIGCRHSHPDSPSPAPAATTPTDILRAALDRVPLVALGETHGIKEYGAFLESVIGNDEITRSLDDIVVEFGSSDHQDIMDRYVAGEPVSQADIDQVLRDTTQVLVWDSPIYASVFSAVRRANQRRPSARVI